MRLIRGRSRKSSGDRTLCQKASTGLTLVKKRCPPKSKRHPSRSTVRLMPPTTESASSTKGRCPRLVNCSAAVSPPGPAPAITTGASSAIRSSPSVPTPEGGPTAGYWASGYRDVQKGQQGVTSQCGREQDKDHSFGF